MQLFKAFFKIVKANLPAISIYVIIFIILTFLLGGSSQGNIDANFQSKELDVYVTDEDNSDASKAIVAYLDSLHKITQGEVSSDYLQDALYYRQIDYVLTIPSGFEENLLAGKTEELFINSKIPGSSTGLFIDQQLTQYTQTLQLYLAGGFSLADAVSATDTTLSEMTDPENLTFQKDNLSAKKEIYYFYQYLPYILIVLLICSMSPIIMKFKKEDINARTNCSSTSLSHCNFQLSLACICYSVLLWALFLLFAFLIFSDTFFTKNALYAALNSFVFLIVATAIAFFASNFCHNSNTGHMIGNLFGLAMSFLCGCFVPQSLLSEGILKVSKFLPAYWYIRSNNMLGGLSNEAFDPNLYWTSIGIQLLFAVAVFILALVFSKAHRQRA